MEAFSKVDAAAGFATSKTDQQHDWQAWNKSGKAEKRAINTTRHLPAFPKLATGVTLDNSHRQVGLSKTASENENIEEENEIEQSKVPTKKRKEVDTANTYNTWVELYGTELEKQGWEELHEPETGKVYWFNKSRGITQYERPTKEESSSFIEASEFLGIKTGYRFTSEGGRTGYFRDDSHPHSNNKRLKGQRSQHPASQNPLEQVQMAIARHLERTQQHNNPTPPSIERTVAKQQNPHIERTNRKSVKSHWVQTVDPLTRKVMFINPATNEKRMENPSEHEASPVVKRNWQKMTDPNTGKVCWYCRHTGETVFSKPMN